MSESSTIDAAKMTHPVVPDVLHRKVRIGNRRRRKEGKCSLHGGRRAWETSKNFGSFYTAVFMTAPGRDRQSYRLMTLVPATPYHTMEHKNGTIMLIYGVGRDYPQ